MLARDWVGRKVGRTMSNELDILRMIVENYYEYAERQPKSDKVEWGKRLAYNKVLKFIDELIKERDSGKEQK